MDRQLRFVNRTSRNITRRRQLYALTPAPQLPRTLAVARPGYKVPRTARVVRHALGGLQPAAAPAHGPIRGQYSDKWTNGKSVFSPARRPRLCFPPRPVEAGVVLLAGLLNRGVPPFQLYVILLY